MYSLNIYTGVRWEFIKETGDYYYQRNYDFGSVAVNKREFIQGYEFFINTLTRWELP
jgi:hypothetical protein